MLKKLKLIEERFKIMAELAPPTSGGRILISFVADMSGSMYTLAEDVRGTINGFVNKQINQPGEAFFTLTVFDTVVETPFDAVLVQDMPEIGEETYTPRGNTALLDAIGQTVRATEDAVAELNPDQVLFIVMTDGQENSSKEWKKEQIVKLIEEKQNDPEDPWQIVFAGSDIDVWDEAGSLGIGSIGNTMAFEKTTAGMLTVSGALCASTLAYRSAGIKTSTNYFQANSVDDENV